MLVNVTENIITSGFSFIQIKSMVRKTTAKNSIIYSLKQKHKAVTYKLQLEVLTCFHFNYLDFIYFVSAF